MNDTREAEALALLEEHEKEVEVLLDITHSHYLQMLSVVEMIETDPTVMQSVMVDFCIRNLSFQLCSAIDNPSISSDTMDILLERIMDALKEEMIKCQNKESSPYEKTFH